MTGKKDRGPRRAPISRVPTATVDRFLEINPNFEKQEQISQSTRAAQEDKKSKKNKQLADRRRSRFILDLSRYPKYPLAQRVEELCTARSIPPSHFVALCIKLGLDAVEDGSLDLDDFIETYEGRNRLYKNALKLEK
jgi:hypothetical protein